MTYRPLRTDFKVHDGTFVTLFDLYFEHKIPVPLKFPVFFGLSSPVIANRKVILHEGFVKQSRDVKPVYVKGGEKNIFMKENFSLMEQHSQLYDEVYNKIYYRMELAKHFSPLFTDRLHHNLEKEFADNKV